MTPSTRGTMTFLDKWKKGFWAREKKNDIFETILGFTATAPWMKTRLELITYETLLRRG